MCVNVFAVGFAFLPVNDDGGFRGVGPLNPDGFCHDPLYDSGHDAWVMKTEPGVDFKLIII